MGHPISEVRMKAPNPAKTALRLAEDVKNGKLTADQAIRQYLGALSFYTKNYMPSYSARTISIGADAIYLAEMKTALKDPEAEEAMRILRDAVREVGGGT